MHVRPDLAAVAALIGDPSRCRILHELLGGSALPAGEIAARLGVAPQTASAHLAKLVDGRLLSVERRGRHRFYSLADPDVAHVIETLGSFAPPPRAAPGRAGDDAAGAIRAARTCYDHVAGRLGVGLSDALVRLGHLRIAGRDFEVTAAGECWFRDLGVDVVSARSARRAFARRCLDWTERRDHLAGALGAALQSRLVELTWVAPRAGTRALRVTVKGREEFERRFGIVGV